MHMENNKEFQLMMRGGCGFFSQYQLWFILSHQNELGINTISIQKTNNKEFVCRVDEHTVKAYLKEEGQI